MSESEIISIEPATGEEFWRGTISDVDDVVGRARRAWPAWAAQPLATRMELVRCFANEVRKESDTLAETIARETGKPLVRVTVTLMKDGQRVSRPVDYQLTDSSTGPVPTLTLAKYIKLTGLAPGRYSAVIESRDIAQQKVLKQEAWFMIVP